ncbi:MAG: precorrin-6y C5,15-methyltransferase (decarboxylating) subunit CbiE [Planctomycetota bacterium]
MAKAAVKITICGCGPGAPEYLTPVVRQAVERAEVLVGARRLLELFPESAAERVAVGADTERALQEIAARHGRRVAVLVTGDAGLCSFAQPVLKRFGREACAVVPGISSVQVAFARLGLDWLDARILSAHAENPRADSGVFVGCEKFAVLLGRKEALAWAAELAGALGSAYRIFVCENLTLKDERVRETTAAELPALKVSSLALVLLVKKGLLA